MASQGPLYPTVSSSSDVAGTSETFVWTNPSNVSADNSGEATITAATFDLNVISERLLTRTYGFTIPADATVDGVVVEIDRRNSTGAASDNRVQLLNATGAIEGNNNALTANDWPTTASIETYGSATTLWGIALTPTIVNDADFGVCLSVQADADNTDVQVDFLRMTVHYTEAAAPAGVVDLHPKSWSKKPMRRPLTWIA